MADYNWCRITGRSMEPEFSVGDEVLIMSVPVENIQPGDIVTFYRDGMLITHRIVRRVCREGKISFEEKADVDVRTSKLSARDIVGRVEAVKQGNCFIKLRHDQQFHQKLLTKFALVSNLIFRTGRFVKKRLGGRMLTFTEKVFKPLILKVLSGCNGLITNSLMSKESTDKTWSRRWTANS